MDSIEQPNMNIETWDYMSSDHSDLLPGWKSDFEFNTVSRNIRFCNRPIVYLSEPLLCLPFRRPTLHSCKVWPTSTPISSAHTMFVSSTKRRSPQMRTSCAMSGFSASCYSMHPVMLFAPKSPGAYTREEMTMFSLNLVHSLNITSSYPVSFSVCHLHSPHANRSSVLSSQEAQRSNTKIQWPPVKAFLWGHEKSDESRHYWGTQGSPRGQTLG